MLAAVQDRVGGVCPVFLALHEQEVAAMARSINGGGENHPSLAGSEDTYELFMIELEELV